MGLAFPAIDPTPTLPGRGAHHRMPRTLFGDDRNEKKLRQPRAATRGARRSVAEKPALIAVLVDIGRQRPARQLLVTGEPDVGQLPHIGQHLLQHRGDQGPASELAMDGEHQEPRWFVLVQIVERPLVYIEQIAREARITRLSEKSVVGTPAIMPCSVCILIGRSA